MATVPQPYPFAYTGTDPLEAEPTEQEALWDIRAYSWDAREYARYTSELTEEATAQTLDYQELWNVEIGLLCALLVAFGLDRVWPR